MSRRNPSTLEVLVLLPWWVSAVLAGVVYFGVPIFAAPFLQVSPAFGPVANMFRMVFPALFVMASVASFFRSLMTRRNLRAQRDVSSLKSLHWKEFEDLLGEVFRRRGYRVEEQLGGGADGGVDLILFRDRQKTLVQCKRRTNKPVPVQTVRELYGVMAADGAQAGILATTTTFTAEARRFAAGKPIQLIDGPELLRLARSVQPPQAASLSPLREKISREPEGRICPACGNSMVLRTAKKGANAGSQFWGCSAFPKCRNTRAIAP